MAVEVSGSAAGRRAIGSANVTLLIAAAALVVMAIGGVALIIRFVDSEWQRELRAWQVRLGIVADSRFAAVDDWLDRQFEDLAGLADNASLQLYMTQLATNAANPDDADVADAQGEYLQNLIAATAARAGFVDSSAAAAVPANLARTGTGGIALIDAKGQTVAATQGMPPLAGRLREFVSGLRPGDRGLLDLFLDTAGRPAMAFAIPVFAVQGNRDAASQIGTVIGVKEVGDELFPLLHQPGETGETALAVLVRRNGEAIEYLSPLPDGKPPLSLRMAADTPDLDAAFAIATPGGFNASRNDYRNREVLVTSRGFAKAPWTLMYTIARAEATRFSSLSLPLAGSMANALTPLRSPDSLAAYKKRRFG